MTIRTATLVLCLLLFSGVQRTLAADSDDLHPYLTSKYTLDLGMFYPDRKLDLRVNGSLVGDNIEFEFDEGIRLERADATIAAEFSWRFSAKWSLFGQYFKSSGSTRVVLAEDIEWGNVIFGAGTNAGVGTRFSVTRIFFGRKFDTREAHEVGIGAGLHWLSMGSFIDGEIFVNGATAAARRSVSAEAPLPNVGAWYNYSISPRWALRSRFDLLNANVGDYDGLMLNIAIGLNFQAFEYVGVGLNYNYFELDVGVDKANWRGDIATTYEGVYVNVSAYF